MDNLTAQIEEKRIEVLEFQRLQNAGNELVALQEKKLRQESETRQRQAAIALQKKIDSFKIDSKVNDEVLTATIALAECLAKWRVEYNKVGELKQLLTQQVQMEFSNRSLAMDENQLIAARQGMVAGLINDIVNERLQLMKIPQTFDVQLNGNGNQLEPVTRNWVNYLLQQIKQGFFPPKRHAGL